MIKLITKSSTFSEQHFPIPRTASCEQSSIGFFVFLSRIKIAHFFATRNSLLLQTKTLECSSFSSNSYFSPGKSKFFVMFFSLLFVDGCFLLLLLYLILFTFRCCCLFRTFYCSNSCSIVLGIVVIIVLFCLPLFLLYLSIFDCCFWAFLFF